MGKKYLVVIDVPGIKKYVFGTERLVEIRGASGVLAQLNEHETPAFLEEIFGKARVDCIFSGGGAGQFIIEADFQKLENVMEQLQAMYSRKTKGGLRILYSVAEYHEDGYSGSLDHAFIQLGCNNKIPEQERIAHIFDLTSFDQIIEWTQATQSFVKNSTKKGRGFK